jgi:glycosyltransferase involved in cell wall biosynthesis
MKRIGIDARFWGEAGPGRYISNLVRELEKIDTTNQYYVFLTSKGYRDYQPANKNFKKVLADFRWYTLAEQFKYPKLLYQYNLDLLHFGQFNMPLPYFKPFTVTIHDMILHDYPIKKGGFKNAVLYPIKKLAYLIIFWWATKRSRAIIVPSKDAKKDLVTRLGVDSSKVTITQEGFDQKLKLPETNANSKGQLKRKYSIEKPYLLYVGSMYPHKNLDRLIEAFSMLSAIKLVLVGKESYFSKQLQKKVKKMGLENRVLFPGKLAPGGYVPDKDLVNFYQNAEAFVFPSLKEGFGIPPLEAMAFRIPVIASNTSCIPEVCGNAALYFNPKNPKDIAEKIAKLLSHKSIRETLIKKGKENVKRFSWARMAVQTQKVFENID